MSHEPWLPGAPVADGGWDRLAGSVYAGVRDRTLSPEAAFDLACFLMDWAQPDSLFGDLAEASTSGSDPGRVADLAGQALALAGFVPDFAQEPRLLTILEQALATVAADLRATGLDGAVQLAVLEGGEPPSAFVRYQDHFGSTSGIAPRDADGGSPVRVLVLVADELQDAVMESLFAAWPVCPGHQRGAHPREEDQHAVWWCTGGTGHVICDVGRWG